MGPNTPVSYLDHG